MQQEGDKSSGVKDKRLAEDVRVGSTCEHQKLSELFSPDVQHDGNRRARRVSPWAKLRSSNKSAVATSLTREDDARLRHENVHSKNSYRKCECGNVENR